MEAHTEDVHKRLRGIKGALESKADVPEDVDEKLRLLDDLTEIVENIDYARGEVTTTASAVVCRPQASTTLLWGSDSVSCVS